MGEYVLLDKIGAGGSLWKPPCRRELLDQKPHSNIRA